MAVRGLGYMEDDFQIWQSAVGPGRGIKANHM
jgi:hypothetical protein